MTYGKLRIRKYAVVLCLLTGLLAGCAPTGPGPAVELPGDLPERWAAKVTVSELPITAGLLSLIEEPSLHSLVEEALANNPDLKATALRLRAQQLRLSETRSRLLPRLNGEFAKGRGNQAVNAQTGERQTSDSHRLGLGISWEIDLWGRLAHEHRAARQMTLARELDYRQARDALAARVIQAWIEQLVSRRALAIEADRLAVLQHIETVLIDRYRDGIGSLDGYSTASSRTQIARADASAQQDAWRQAVRKLEVLAGRIPEGKLTLDGPLPAMALPPVDAPAVVLQQRPDIRSALARLAAARHRTQAAGKAMLPRLDLTGQLFRSGVRLADIGSASSSWGILGTLLQPLFEGGRLLNEAKAQQSEAEAALLDLHTVVLRALKEVEDALDRDRDLAAQAASLELAYSQSQKSSRYFFERYRQGLDNIQTLLIAQEQEMLVKLRLNRVRADRLSNRVDLALAVGIGPGEYRLAEDKERKP